MAQRPAETAGMGAWEATPTKQAVVPGSSAGRVQPPWMRPAGPTSRCNPMTSGMSTPWARALSTQARRSSSLFSTDRRTALASTCPRQPSTPCGGGTPGGGGAVGPGGSGLGAVTGEGVTGKEDAGGGAPGGRGGRGETGTVGSSRAPASAAERRRVSGTPTGPGTGTGGGGALVGCRMPSGGAWTGRALASCCVVRSSSRRVSSSARSAVASRF